MWRQNVQNSPKSITRTEDTTKLPSDSLGLCEKLGYERGKTWYDHTSEPVLESENTTILWDFKGFIRFGGEGKQARHCSDGQERTKMSLNRYRVSL